MVINMVLNIVITISYLKSVFTVLFCDLIQAVPLNVTSVTLERAVTTSTRHRKVTRQMTNVPGA